MGEGREGEDTCLSLYLVQNGTCLRGGEKIRDSGGLFSGPPSHRTFHLLKKNSSINNLIILSYMVFENNKKSLILNEKHPILSQIKLSTCLRSLYCSFLRHMW